MLACINMHCSHGLEGGQAWVISEQLSRDTIH